MNKFLTKFLFTNLPILGIIIVTIILAIANYTPGTFLSGWDTLHPEFNFQINFMRTFFGVFRPEQGLGALSAHAHMVELVRIPFLYLFSFFTSLNNLRYLYIFSCLLAGSIGMYLLLQRNFVKDKIASFLGALFYLLNLGTYQTFLVPLEMFTVLYASLPFVFLLFLEYLKAPSKKKLLLYSFSVLALAPAAYASTLWLVFFAALVLFFFPIVWLERKTDQAGFKKLAILLGITLLVNLFWLLPNTYFATNGASTVTHANINKLFSEEAFLKNKQFGNITDILFLKSFYFDWGIYDYKTGNFEQLTKVFQTHLLNPWILTIGYIFASFFIIGYAYIFKTARKYFYSFTILLLFCLFFLINKNFPFTHIFSFLQDHLPLFKEALRFPGDKILNIFVFITAIFFAFSQLFLIGILKKIKHFTFTKPLFGTIISALIFIYTLPLFTGNLIHPFMRVTIPMEYFNMFSALKGENGRIANFPVNSPWGWVYHNWYGDKKPSYQGAGFLYFGLEKSLMDRDFDRWNPLNEQYYREISYAIYTKDENLLKKVLFKYDISDLLIDTSVIVPGSDPKSLYYDELFSLLNSLEKDGFIEEKKQFGSFLTTYRVQKQNPKISNISSATATTAYLGSYYIDILQVAYDNYYSQNNKKNVPFLPLTNLFDNESKLKEGTIATSDESLTLNAPKRYVISATQDDTPIIPAVLTATTQKNGTRGKININIFPATPIFDAQNSLNSIQGDFDYSTSTEPIIVFNDDIFSLQNIQQDNPTVLGTVLMNKISNNISLFNTNGAGEKYLTPDIPFSFFYCDRNNDNSSLHILSLPSTLTLTSQGNNSICISLPLNFIKQKSSFSTLVSIDFSVKNASGVSVCLANIKTGICQKSLNPSIQNGAAKIRFAINRDQITDTQLIITVDKGEDERTLDNISVLTQSAVSEATISTPLFQSTIPKSFKKVAIPKIFDANYYFQPKEDNNPTNDCKNTMFIAEKTFRDSAYRYSSEKGSFCDHVSFQNLSHSLSYLVYVKSKNDLGLPMSICITNTATRRCDIYAKLSKFSTPRDDVFFLPQSGTGSGYDVNLENFGITGSPSINSLYSIAFVPFPFQLLSSIQEGEAKTENFPGRIVVTKTHNPHLLSFTTSGGPTLVVLSSAYNKGYHAYNISCKNELVCLFQALVSPVFGKKLEHIEVNGWKNGWIAPKEGNFIIVYTPQYLEYLGLVLLAGTLITLSFRIFKR